MTQKVALVTGASRGIGLAVARELHKQGFRIALHYRRDAERAQRILSELEGSLGFQYDLEQAEQCELLIKDVKEKMGSLSLLVNNAGISIDQLVTFAKPLDFTKILDTNLRPVFLLSKSASRLMIKQKTGGIINITSVIGHMGNAGQGMYAAAKSATTGLSMSMAKEMAAFGIRVNCVAPGFIATEMTDKLGEDVRASILKQVPLGRLGTAEEVAQCVAFLASDKASYVTGTTLHVNGGMYCS